jgi:hypothetical protein
MSTNSTTGDRAPSQGGVIDGLNPTHYNPKDPVTIFIIQASSPLPRRNPPGDPAHMFAKTHRTR